MGNKQSTNDTKKYSLDDFEVLCLIGRGAFGKVRDVCMEVNYCGVAKLCYCGVFNPLSSDVVHPSLCAVELCVAVTHTLLTSPFCPKVWQVKKKDTGRIFAMKCLDKKDVVHQDLVEHTK